MKQRVLNSECQKWVMKLMRYDCEIQYWLGLKNQATGALSRLQSPISLLTVIISQVVQLDQLKKEVEDDATLQLIVKKIKVDPTTKYRFTLVDGYLLLKGKLYLPKGSTLIPLMLKEGHDGWIGGHSGVLKTYKRISL